MTNVDEADWWLRLLHLPAGLSDSLSFRSMRYFVAIPKLRERRELQEVGFFYGDLSLDNAIISATVNAALNLLLKWIIEP